MRIASVSFYIIQNFQNIGFSVKSDEQILFFLSGYRVVKNTMGKGIADAAANFLTTGLPREVQSSLCVIN
jgi:hypothetical protein